MNSVYIKATDIPLWLVDRYFKGNDLISVDDLINALYEADAEIERLKEELEDFKQDVESNYKYMPTEEQIDYDRANW